MSSIQQVGDKVLANVERVIVGKHQEVRLALVALMCRGHLLIEDVPGTGKTVLAKAIARSLGCTFRRIQFTPDLLPSDVTGLSIYNQKTQEFEFRPGPIMSQVVLADEINRATPKTQSSLLECMEERQATIDGITHPMPDPFLVIATQNPIEYEGTFALPEAQLDRFMLRIRLGYPALLDEIVILDEQKRTHPIEDLAEVCSVEELRELQAASARSTWTRRSATTSSASCRSSRTHPDVYLGARPRGSIALYRAGQALAGLLGRDYVIPDDIKVLAEPALAHRVIIKTSSSIHDVSAAHVVRELLDSTPIEAPPGRPAVRARCARAPAPADPAPRPDRTRGRPETDAPPTPARRPRRRPRGRRVLDRAPRSCSSSCTSAARRRRLVHPHAAGAVRPRGGLRGEPAVTATSATGSGSRTRCATPAAAQAVARGPQPDHPARRPARPGDLARGRGGALVAGPGRPRASWPLPHRAAPDPDRGPVRVLRGVGGGGPGRHAGRLPEGGRAAAVEAAAGEHRGRHAQAERTLQTTPLATTVRPYAPGDSMNRIHWRSTAKTGEIQVKEFDLEQTADAWIFLDLDAAAELGSGETSTTEVAVRVAASVAEKALSENRAVGLTVNGHRMTVLPGRPRRPPAAEDPAAPRRRRGGRRTPLDEALLTGLSRLRRGMTAIVISASQDPSFVRPLAALRTRGIGTVVISLDAPAFEPAPDEAAADAARKHARALRHTLAEYQLPTYTVGPTQALAEALAR